MPITDRGSSPAKPWVADYYDAKGQRRQVACASRIEAQRELLARAGTKSRKDLRQVTTGALFAHVLKSQSNVRYPKGIERLASDVDKHLLPRIADKPVRMVDKADLAATLSTMEDNLSPRPWRVLSPIWSPLRCGTASRLHHPQHCEGRL